MSERSAKVPNLKSEGSPSPSDSERKRILPLFSFLAAKAEQGGRGMKSWGRGGVLKWNWGSTA